MSEKLIWAISILVSISVLGLAITYTKGSTTQSTGPISNAQIEFVNGKSHAWGKIPITNGNAEHVFEIKNVGTDPLEISNFLTSCMCTKTIVTINGTSSPPFGMHTKSGWVGSVEPGQTAEIKAVFDPMFHGPQGTGPIARVISFKTNTQNNKLVELKLAGNVVKGN